MLLTASSATERSAEVIVLECNLSYLVDSIDTASVLPETLNEVLFPI